MSAEHLEDVLSESPLKEWQKQELRTASDKTEYFRKAIYCHRSADAENSWRDFRRYMLKNGIFIPEPLEGKFLQLGDLLWDALKEHQANEEHEVRPRLNAQRSELNEKGEALRQALESDVQQRLWSVKALDV